MGLITKTVKVKWHSTNKNHYVNLGYKFTKMGDEFEVKVEDLTKGNESKLLCVCNNCGKELNWTNYMYEICVKENGNTYCKSCSLKLIGSKKIQSTKLKNSKSFEQWCIENNKKDILDRWDYELNNCNPNEITFQSHKKYWFKCNKHPKHKSELKYIKSFVNGQEGSIECNQCNSFAQWMLDNNLKIEDYWDYDKNVINPWDISKGCRQKIWIKCQEKDYHESYSTTCASFTKGRRCSYCSGRMVHPKDSLGQYIIDNFGKDFLNKIWSDKNSKSSFEYMPNSHSKVWWKCLDDKHDDYERSCKSSYNKDFRCPQCIQERKESIIEEQTRLYLETLNYTILHEYNCTIIPKNSKTNMCMPFDNEIKELKLIIEVHGRQHYQSEFFKTINKCSQEEAEQHLHYQQVKDRYKRIYAIQHGYYYLEIPYTAFDKQETYKKLIDDKINEIKQIKNNQQEESA